MTGTSGAVQRERDSLVPGWKMHRAAEGVPREEPAVIGRDTPLVGTLSRPTTEPRGTAILLLNAGLVGRAGPDGLHVRLARSLGVRGYPVLRFDYSGVGDSPARRDRTPIHEARVLETRSAIDWLGETLEVDEVVLLGICTGADNAFRSALSDERVRGLVLLDGYPYRTRGWWVRHYLPRLFRGSSWRTLLRVGAAPPGTPNAAGDDPGWDGVARVIPTREEVTSQLAALMERETQLYFIYTGGFSDWVNHPGQLQAALRPLRLGDQVRVEYWPGADHVFRSLASQRDLSVRVAAWLDARRIR